MGDAWAFTKSVGSGVWDGVASTAEGLWSLAKGGYSLATDSQARDYAWETTKRVASVVKDYGATAVDDPAKPYRDARDGALAAYDRFDVARQEAGAAGKSAEFWGHATGRAGFEIAAIGAATKAGKVGEAARVAEVAADATKAAKATEAFGDVSSASARAAAALEKPALRAADTSLSALEHCPLKKPPAATTLDAMYVKAPAAKEEIDALAAKVVAEHGGRVAPTAVKSRARALEKIEKEYGGDPAGLTDLARNTIVVPAGNEDAVIQSLRADNPGIEVKKTMAAENAFGYSDIKVRVPTENGLIAEIQVNSPEMIYAKESTEDARAILGDETYQRIASQPGLPPGGLGHKMYQEARGLPKGSPQRELIQAQSREYYAAFGRK